MKACLTALFLGVACFLFQAGAAEPTEAERKSFLETKVKAEKGDAKAQTLLGIFYQHGLGVAKDEAEAVKWYRKAADQGYASAQSNLGVMYQYGQGMVKDEVEAVKWYRKAADQGDAPAQSCLGDMYQYGQGVVKDEVEAVKWHQKAAEQGNWRSCLNLAEISALGLAGAADDQVAQRWYDTALRYSGTEGRTVEATVTHPNGKIEQTSYWEPARETVRLKALVIGLKIFNRSVDPNLNAESVRWLQRGVGGRDTDGLIRAALDHLREGGENFAEVFVKNPKKFANLVRFCAELGWKDCQTMLARLYQTGDVVQKDSQEAAKWYLRAAEQNDAWAQSNLGVMYASGEGVEKDYAEALKWFRRAAEQNQDAAQANLGLAYAEGRGVEKDAVEAYAWWNLAAKTFDNAATDRDLLERRMTAQQIAEGQKRTKELRAMIEARVKKTEPRNPFNQFEPVPPDAKPKSTGSGFFITEDGYFITNQHVAGEGATVRLVTAAGTIAAKVVKVDKANDVALLKAAGKFTALPVITSRGVRLGATAATVGFPNIGLQGFAPKLARGEIASLAGAQDDARHFQISAPIQPGNSGGALVDERGNVIGVVVAKLSQKAALATSGALAENVNYAVKSSYLLSFLESVPEVAAKLKEAHTKDRKFEDVVKSVEQATVLVLVY